MILSRADLQTLSPHRQLRFIETLGKGGFGAVYLAEVVGADNFVLRLAVKILHEEVSENSDFAARQRDEARLLGRLNHDHIVKVVDLTQIHGRPAVLMEYVEGVDAARLLQAEPVPVRAALQIAAATASALRAASEARDPSTGRPLRVVHRDIKPANLLISAHGGVKVLDFGIARADLDREGLTGSAQFGTARYMAPEQWLTGQVSPAVDIHALGLTLVELISRRSVARCPLEPRACEQQRQAEVEGALEPGWPNSRRDELQALLLEMVAWEPERRPPAAQVQERCLELADGLSGEGLARHAARVVPRCLEARRSATAALPVLPPVLIPATPMEVLIPSSQRPQSTQPLEELPGPRPVAVVEQTSPPQPRPDRRGLALGLAGLGLGLGAALCAGAGLLLGWWAQREGAPLEAPAVAEAPAEPPAPAPAPTAPVEAPPASAPGPAAPAPAPAPDPRPEVPILAASAPPSPEPSPPVPEASPAPAASLAPVMIGTRPLGILVVVDGRAVGPSPARLELRPGLHRLIFEVEGEPVEVELEVPTEGGAWRWEATSGLVRTR